MYLKGLAPLATVDSKEGRIDESDDDNDEKQLSEDCSEYLLL